MHDTNAQSHPKYSHSVGNNAWIAISIQAEQLIKILLNRKKVSTIFKLHELQSFPWHYEQFTKTIPLGIVPFLLIIARKTNCLIIY